MASSKYANIVDLPIEEIIKSLKKLIDKARAVVRTGKRTAEDVLNAFTREHFGQFVVVKMSDGALMAALGSGQVIDQTITRSKIMGRVEHGVTKKNYVEYFIEEQVLKAHCVSMSFGYKQFIDQISKTDGYVVEYQRKDMMAKTKGPQMRVRAISISRPLEDDPNAEQLSVGAVV